MIYKETLHKIVLILTQQDYDHISKLCLLLHNNYWYRVFWEHVIKKLGVFILVGMLKSFVRIPKNLYPTFSVPLFQISVW